MDDALDRALKVFWRKGYEGTTLPDLTRAMGINRPSLYAAFGNKQSLFCKALHRYNERHNAFLREALAAPTAQEVARRILHGAINLQTNPENPRGCLTVRGTLSCAGSTVIRRHLDDCRNATEAAMTARFQRAADEGDLPGGASPQDLTRYLTTVMQGMAIQSASGASRAQLQRVAQTALRAFLAAPGSG